MPKKIFSVAVLIMLMTSILGIAIRPGNCAVVLSQNFDSEATGVVPQEWTVADSNLNSLTVNDSVYYGSSGKSARYADLASFPGGCAYVGRNFDDQHSAIAVSFAIRAENPDYLMFYLDSNDGIYHGPNIYFIPSGFLAYYDDNGWHYLLRASADTWYLIKMVIDIPTNTYDIYVDNVLLAQGAHFRYFGTATHLNDMNFGGNSWEKPIGFIDDISIETIARTAPATTATTLAGSHDYLLQEDVNIRIDAQVSDVKNLAPVSNATVSIEIYYPNGSVLVSDVMTEKLTGIYEWQSSQTIHQMNLEKGVYLVRVQASAAGETPSTAIQTFHVDPPSGTQSTAGGLEAYYLVGALAVAGLVIGVVFHRRHKREPMRTTLYGVT